MNHPFPSPLSNELINDSDNSDISGNSDNNDSSVIMKRKTMRRRKNIKK